MKLCAIHRVDKQFHETQVNFLEQERERERERERQREREKYTVTGQKHRVTTERAQDWRQHTTKSIAYFFTTWYIASHIMAENVTY